MGRPELGRGPGPELGEVWTGGRRERTDWVGGGRCRAEAILPVAGWGLVDAGEGRMAEGWAGDMTRREPGPGGGREEDDDRAGIIPGPPRPFPLLTPPRPCCSINCSESMLSRRRRSRSLRARSSSSSCSCSASARSRSSCSCFGDSGVSPALRLSRAALLCGRPRRDWTVVQLPLSRACTSAASSQLSGTSS